MTRPKKRFSVRFKNGMSSIVEADECRHGDRWVIFRDTKGNLLHGFDSDQVALVSYIPDDKDIQS